MKINKKILIFGNSTTKGLAAQLTRDLQADCMGRATHKLDMQIKQNRAIFIEATFNYDVVILCAYAPEFSQVLLLQELYSSWVEKSKKGIFLVIGSSCERLMLNQPTDLPWMSYAVEKKALLEQSRVINANSHKTTPDIFVTYISPHHMNTEHFKYDDALSVLQVSQAIQWALSCDFHVEELSIRNW